MSVFNQQRQGRKCVDPRGSTWVSPDTPLLLWGVGRHRYPLQTEEGLFRNLSHTTDKSPAPADLIAKGEGDFNEERGRNEDAPAAVPISTEVKRAMIYPSGRRTHGTLDVLNFPAWRRSSTCCEGWTMAVIRKCLIDHHFQGGSINDQGPGNPLLHLCYSYTSWGSLPVCDSIAEI